MNKSVHINLMFWKRCKTCSCGRRVPNVNRFCEYCGFFNCITVCLWMISKHWLSCLSLSEFNAFIVPSFT